MKLEMKESRATVTIVNRYAITDINRGVTLAVCELLRKRDFHIQIKNILVTPNEIILDVVANSDKHLRKFKDICATRLLPDNKNLWRIK